MPRRDVRDLMRHHAGQLGFGVRFQDQARVDEEEAARKREGVDILGVDHLDRERNLGVGIAHQVLAHAIDVLGDLGIVDDLGLPLDLLRQAFAERDLLLDRVDVQPGVDLAVADLIGIVILFVSGGRRKREEENRGRS